MKVKIIKILSTLAMFAIPIFFFNYVYADSIGLNSDLNSYAKTQTAPSEVNRIGNNILGVVTAVGAVVSVVTLVILGIKYMAGSVDERAAYKKSLVPYLVGAIILFAISTIMGAVFKAFSAIN